MSNLRAALEMQAGILKASPVVKYIVPGLRYAYAD